jgi:hypothetical protein
MPIRSFDMARRWDVIAATSDILERLHIGPSSAIKSALVVGDYLVWQHMFTGLMMTVSDAAVSEQSSAAHGVLPGLQPSFGARASPPGAGGAGEGTSVRSPTTPAAPAAASDELAAAPLPWAALLKMDADDVVTIVELERLLNIYTMDTCPAVQRKSVLKDLGSKWGLNTLLPEGARLAAARPAPPLVTHARALAPPPFVSCAGEGGCCSRS